MTAWRLNKEKTHCPYGHPYSGDNLGVKKDGARLCRQCGRDRQKQYRNLAAYKAKNARHARKYYAKYPEKAKAKRLLRTAIEAGKIIRPQQCEACWTATRVHAHHEDYSKPLEVKWLCALCHVWEHRNEAR